MQEQNKTWHQGGFSSIKSCGHLFVTMINNTQLTIHKLNNYAFSENPAVIMDTLKGTIHIKKSVTQQTFSLI